MVIEHSRFFDSFFIFSVWIGLIFFKFERLCLNGVWKHVIPENRETRGKYLMTFLKFLIIIETVAFRNSWTQNSVIIHPISTSSEKNNHHPLSSSKQYSSNIVHYKKTKQLSISLKWKWKRWQIRIYYILLDRKVAC